jgi:hypothetical protein
MDGTDVCEVAFEYSKRLALFQQERVRTGMFIDEAPQDTFSKTLHHLATRIISQMPLAKNG